MSDWIVVLACGHWFPESTSDELDIDPNQRRTCGRPQHFPGQYDAVTLSADSFNWPDGTYDISRSDTDPLADDEELEPPPDFSLFEDS